MILFNYLLPMKNVFNIYTSHCYVFCGSIARCWFTQLGQLGNDGLFSIPSTISCIFHGKLCHNFCFRHYCERHFQMLSYKSEAIMMATGAERSSVLDDPVRLRKLYNPISNIISILGV